MDDLPRSAEDYGPEDLRQVKAGCLEVATRLGDLLDDLVIVGGLVPALLVDLTQEGTLDETDPLSRHVGTRDLDLGFAIGLVDEGRYTEISTRLLRCSFAPDRNEEGNPTPQRWRHETVRELTVDFLISPTREDEKGGSIKHLEGDLAAIVIPGLERAFEDLCRVELSGTRLSGAEATQEIPVCGPGAFVLLKALACDRRGKDKDKYDLFYMIRNYGEGPRTVARHFRPFLESGHREAEEAREILGDLFESRRSIGPVAISQFVYGESDDALQADALAFIRAFLAELEDEE
jgi:hypothetical protein